MRRTSSPKQLDHWTRTLADLEAFYASAVLPAEPVRLSVCETITDARKFVTGHLGAARRNFGVPTFAIYVKRLITFRNIITNTQNKIAA